MKPGKKNALGKQQGTSVELQNRRPEVIAAIQRSLERRRIKMELVKEQVVTTSAVRKYFKTKEDYLAMKEVWASNKNRTVEQHLLYNLLRGINPKRGFTAATNKNKINNGHAPFYTYQESWRFLRTLKTWLSEPDRKFWNGTGKELAAPYLAAFGITVTPELALEALNTPE